MARDMLSPVEPSISLQKENERLKEELQRLKDKISGMYVCDMSIYYIICYYFFLYK